jgi:hypothetical protein
VLDNDYFVVLGLDIPDYFTPVAGFVGHLSKHAFIFVVRAVVVAHLDNLIFNFGKSLVQIFKSFAILGDFFLSDFFIDGACYFFDESEFEEIFKNVEAFLEYVFLLCFVIVWSPLLKNAVLFLAVHNTIKLLI